MAAPISNYVTLSPGVSVKLHFSDHRVLARQIEDPIRKVMVERESLLLYVDKINGNAVDKIYSILSQKHAAEFAGYLPEKRYRAYDFTVVKDAAGTVPPRIVSVVPSV